MLPLLDKQDIRKAFLHTMSNVYNMKINLIKYLPLMAGKASYSTLKMQIINASVGVNAAILRMDMMFKLLDQERKTLERCEDGKLDLEAYLHSSIDNQNSYRSDYILITHLMVLAGIEVNSFQQLRQLSNNLQPKQINALVLQCLKEAIDSKKIFLDLAKTYMLS